MYRSEFGAGTTVTTRSQSVRSPLRQQSRKSRVKNKSKNDKYKTV